MEYIGVYEITRKMHSRPCSEVISTIGALKRNPGEVEINLDHPQTGEKLDYKSLINLLSSGCLFHKGERIRVVVRGEYSQKTLQECANRVGEVFSLDSKLPRN